MPNTLTTSMVTLITDLLQPNVRKRLSSLQKLRNYQALKHLDFLSVEKQLVSAKFTPSNDRLNCDPTYELEEIMIESNPLHKKKRRKRKKSNVSCVIIHISKYFISKYKHQSQYKLIDNSFWTHCIYWPNKNHWWLHTVSIIQKLIKFA